MTELDELLAFVANALASAARTRRHNGLPVPPLALTIARWCADTARSGTARQPLADLTETGDRGGMEHPLLITIAALPPSCRSASAPSATCWPTAG